MWPNLDEKITRPVESPVAVLIIGGRHKIVKPISMGKIFLLKYHLFCVFWTVYKEEEDFPPFSQYLRNSFSNRIQ